MNKQKDKRKKVTKKMKKVCYLNGPGGGVDCLERFCGPERLHAELCQRIKKYFLTDNLILGQKDRIKETFQKDALKKGPWSFIKSFHSLRKINPDIIHGHGSLNIAFLLVLYQKLLGKKTILTFTDFKKNFITNYKLLNRLDAVIVQTDFAQRVLIRKGVDKHLIHQITYGVESSFKKAKAYKDIRTLGKKIVLYFGDARRVRGFNLFLRSIDHLKSINCLDKDIIILMCIRSFHRDADLPLLRKLQEEGSNIIVMRLKDYPCSIAEIIASCDLVVLPFLQNTLEPPLTIMEVSAVGTPLITTDVGGNKEVVSSNALVMDQTSPSLLANAIQTILKKSPPLKKRDFNWEKTIEGIKKIYD